MFLDTFAVWFMLTLPCFTYEISDACFSPHLYLEALSVPFATILPVILCILIANAQQNGTLGEELVSFKRRMQEA
jgi:hypothetical protein